ncbi:hypothetical protein ACXLRP_003501 [Acinetobacter baumannii]|uniref:hypothetical protein n=1 Tax=Acinetobacter baumannii TaxID=470 RepID=UPI0003DF2510|nr:hypothetical protein [Acinetobacter baumannii]EJD6061781.1 hypothetical protein [Acinetobacter baumannii]EKU0962537.1 hypothetical protein [Acinetobacter baumannii]EKU2652078.1 hypothetical protein [Acinetobacter baumannii]EKW2534405.1 hypothetical protein [Acinetobacter baumannii]ELT5726968.1 hypothetical protein [Acinetobacter baumannii]
MNSIWFTLFFCLCCFIWGFAYSYGSWIEKATNGQPFEAKGKVYKIIELDVVEKGVSHE